MRNIKFKQSKKTKPLLDGPKRQLLKDHHKTHSVQQLAIMLGITPDQVIGQCGKYYFSYFNEKGAA